MRIPAHKPQVSQGLVAALLSMRTPAQKPQVSQGLVAALLSKGTPAHKTTGNSIWLPLSCPREYLHTHTPQVTVSDGCSPVHGNTCTHTHHRLQHLVTALLSMRTPAHTHHRKQCLAAPLVLSTETPAQKPQVSQGLVTALLSTRTPAHKPQVTASGYRSPVHGNTCTQTTGHSV